MLKPKPAPKGTAALYRAMDEMFRIDSNMPVGTVLILMLVALKSGTPNEAPTLSDIASAVGMDLSRVSRNVKTLVESGLVGTRRDALDPRSKLTYLTDEGHRLVTRITDTLN